MDKDIQEMFRQKNREMLILNLKLDIERNIAILIDTLTNILNLQFSIATKNIFSMYNEKLSLKDITIMLSPLQNKTFAILSDKIYKKKDLLLEQLGHLEFEKEQMENYYGLVFATTDEIIDSFECAELESLKKEVIQKFHQQASQILQEDSLDILNYRIRDYIIDRLFGKLKEKVKEEIFIRDNNLSNKGKESYEKFQELENKTTNV